MITPLLPYPAGLLKTRDSRTMVISDLHIGWEMTLSQKGIHVPTQTPKMLKRIAELTRKHHPQRLLILGDVKHTIATAEKAEWHDVPDLFSELRKIVPEILVVRGNHDGNLTPLLPEGIELLPATGAAIGDTGFFHGHQWPSPALLTCKTLVMGHVHPVVAFFDPVGFRVVRQVWVKASLNAEQLLKTLLKKQNSRRPKSAETSRFEPSQIIPRASQLFIMPSFNDFLGGRPLNERTRHDKARDEMIAGPVLRSEAVDMKNAEIYLLDGTFLGSLEQLRKMS